MKSTSFAAQQTVQFDQLRRRIDGVVFAAGDEGWETARLPWNLKADQRPAAVVVAGSAADVAETVRFAAANGLRLAPQGTGHGAGAIGALESSILLKTSQLGGVEIDAAARRARAGAGVVWEEVVQAAAAHGLVALHGSSPDVGVVGYSLGGGMGWLARRYGLAANSVLAVEIVTADGEARRADAEEHPDLFWAIRGGGGSFGVVTAIEFALYPLEQVYAGWLMWPFEQASEVL
jgi:FAD/FMN-containing dehydrogenase